MVKQKKVKGALVDVKKLSSDEELDKALDEALDALFGPDEEKDAEEIEPENKKTSGKKTKRGK